MLSIVSMPQLEKNNGNTSQIPPSVSLPLSSEKKHGLDPMMATFTVQMP